MSKRVIAEADLFDLHSEIEDEDARQQLRDLIADSRRQPDLETMYPHMFGESILRPADEAFDTVDVDEIVAELEEDAHTAESLEDAQEYIEEHNDFESSAVRSLNKAHDLYVRVEDVLPEDATVPDNVTVERHSDNCGLYFNLE